jgi:hypothetical protein
LVAPGRSAALFELLVRVFRLKSMLNPPILGNLPEVSLMGTIEARGVVHFSIAVSDLEASSRFYTEVSA